MSHTSKSDPLGSILERLNGTTSKVTKLRRCLYDLETELNEIRQLCENEIRARSTATTTTTSTATIIPGSQRQLVSMAGIPISTSTSPIPGVSSSSEVFGSSRSSLGRVKKLFGSLPVFRSLGIVTGPAQAQIKASAPVQRQAENLLIQQGQTLFQRPPRPPTDPCPFPENIDLSAYPPELKREADGWFFLFNRSPKIERVLDVNLVHELVHKNDVRCVRFSPDGKWLAVGCRRTAHIYDVETGIEISVLDHGDEYILGVCFSPDGKYLATSAGWIRMWDINKKQIRNVFQDESFIKSRSLSVCFSPNGKFIVLACHDIACCDLSVTVHLWDVDSRSVKTVTIDDHYSLGELWGASSTAAISPDGRLLAVAWTLVVSILDLTTCVLVQRLRGHESRILSVAFTPDGKGLISGSWDHALKYWDVSRLGTSSGTSTALTSPLDISSSPCFMNFTGQSLVTSVAVSHDGAWVVSGSYDGRVLFWDMRTGVAHCMLSADKTHGRGVNLSPTGNVLATAHDKVVRIWSYGT